MTFQVDWDERKGVWLAWCHEYGAHEFGAESPVEALHGLIELLNNEKEG